MDAKELGRDIRRRRKAAGMTQAGLAARAGISQQHLSLLESDPEGAQLRTLRRVLTSLGLSFSVMPTANEDLRRRQDARKRMNEAEVAFPAWSTPTADLERVGEMADLYIRLHGPQTAMADPATMKAWREFRRRMSLLAVG